MNAAGQEVDTIFGCITMPRRHDGLLQRLVDEIKSTYHRQPNGHTHTTKYHTVQWQQMLELLLPLQPICSDKKGHIKVITLQNVRNLDLVHRGDDGFVQFTIPSTFSIELDCIKCRARLAVGEFIFP